MRRLKLRLYLYLTFATYWCIDFFQPYVFLAVESESLHPRAGHVCRDLGSSAGLLLAPGRVIMLGVLVCSFHDRNHMLRFSAEHNPSSQTLRGS